MVNNILDRTVALGEILPMSRDDDRRGCLPLFRSTMLPSSLPLRVLFAWVFLLLLAAASLRAQELRYTVDIRGRGSHTIGVRLDVDSLAAGDTLFQFAATAPGTYQT